MHILFVVQIICRYTDMVRHTGIFLQLPVLNSPEFRVANMHTAILNHDFVNISLKIFLHPFVDL